VRPFLATLLAAVSVGATAFGVGWVVQAEALPQPRPAAVVAARAAEWLYRYRLAVSTFSIGAGRPVHATCVQTWFPTPGGDSDRGTVLRLDGGSTVITVLRHKLEVFGRRHGQGPSLTRAQLVLAGCPRLLADTIAVAAQSGGGVSVSLGRTMGKGALLLRVSTGKRLLIVHLAEHTGEPIGVSFPGRAVQGHSVIRLAPVTRELLSTRGLG
jgi:hypothetical protein